MNTMHNSFEHGEFIAPKVIDADSAADRNSQTSKPGLSDGHNFNDKPRTNFVGPVIGGLIVAIMVGAAGFYIYTHYVPQHHRVVASRDLPAPSPPLKVAPAAPPPVTATAPATPNTGPDSALAHSPYATMSMTRPAAKSK